MRTFTYNGNTIMIDIKSMYIKKKLYRSIRVIYNNEPFFVSDLDEAERLASKLLGIPVNYDDGVLT